MHKINSLIVSLLVCFMCLSCGSDPSDDIEVKDPISYSFSIDKQTINVNSSAQEENISVNTNGKWNVSCEAAWITVSPTTGTNSSSVKVSIAENANPDDRNATLVFMSVPLEKTYTVMITQAAKQFTFSIDKDSISASSEASTEVISITTNDEWSISSDVDWISMSKKSGKGDAKITLNIAENKLEASRRGIISIEGKNSGSKTVVVSQEGLFIPYLTFHADDVQILSMSYDVPTLEYSVNGEVWQPLGTNMVTFGGHIGDAKVRGKSSFGTAKKKNYSTVSFYSTFSFSNNVPTSCDGDIRTLVDYENYRNVSGSNVRFMRLFENCTVLTSAPDLPCTNLEWSCYQNMFSGCTSLVRAPELPATNLRLSYQTYREMFKNCISLKTAPDLPATVLSSECYSSMFEGCTSLEKAPELPAKSLEERCYSSMFKGCTSLTAAPELPATEIDESCCSSMFQDCTSLTDAPSILPATWLAWNCYAGMFRGCTSLTKVPELPAKNLSEHCYEQMFSGCTSLAKAPALPATELYLDCYLGMFSDCTSLTSTPELPAMTLASACYGSMFRNCTSLVSAPKLPATELSTACYGYMFSGCTSLKTAPDLPATTLAANCYNYMFQGCKALNYIKMMATDISANCCLYYWVEGVSKTGTFVKNRKATWKDKNNTDIDLSGWRVEYADE